MRTLLHLPLALCLILAACSDAGRIPDSDLSRRQVEIRQRNDVVYMMQNPQTDDSFDGTTREAAFTMVRGLRADQAVATFRADGAVCRGRICTWRFRDRENWADVAFGLRPPGPRRTRDWFRSVTMEADVVADPKDLAVRHWLDGVAIPK